MAFTDPVREKEYKHQWYLDHRELNREKDTQYRKDNRDKIITRVRKWQTAHPERKRQYAKNRRMAHPDRVRVKWAKDYYASIDHGWRSKNIDHLKNYNKNWRMKNLAKIAKYKKDHQEPFRERERIRNLTRKHGMSLEQWQVMYDMQKGACAICGKTDNFGGSGKCLRVDHNHQTGKIRGLLCNDCNLILGKFHDDPEIMTKAINYLIKYKSN